MSPRLLTALLLLTSLAAGACGSTDGSTDGSGGANTGGAVAGETGGSSGSGGAPSASGGASATGGGDAETGGATSTTGGAGGGPGTGGTSGGNDPVLSVGCSSAPPEAGLRTIDVMGTEREYILTLPDDYDPEHPYRLIFGFHGAMYDAEWVANGEEPLTGPYFGMQEESGGEAIFVAGQALPGSWSNTDGRDLAYVEALLASLEAELCIDESRVFAAGFSMGGIMTVRIGCALGDVFRAIAPMSPSLPTDCAESSEPVAYWSSHGESDMTITPESGTQALGEFLERNGCTEASAPSSPEGCVSYEDCSDGNPVSRCLFDGAHVPAPFAGEAIWGFFSQF